MSALQEATCGGEIDGLVPDRFSGVGRLLNAVSTVLHETLDRFENASGKVTQTVLARGNAADFELIQQLQNFDRLHQEFSAIKEMINHCAVASAEGRLADTAQWEQDCVSSVMLTDVKRRLLACLGAAQPDPAPMPVEMVF
jgi:hypothetical protein